MMRMIVRKLNGLQAGRVGRVILVRGGRGSIDFYDLVRIHR